MKVNQVVKALSMVALLGLATATVTAQDNNNGDRPRRNRDAQNQDGGPGGPGGRGNFDPAQFQQRMMEGIRDQLGFTNDTDWNAVEPLVQKVMDARRDTSAGGGFGRMFGRGRGGQNGDQGNNRRRGGMFGGQPSPEEEALQKAIDDNAPAAQIKDLLAKYKAAHKEKEAKLAAAQADLKKVLTVKQEAQATLLGLVQ